jgi:hypothetical protein
LIERKFTEHGVAKVAAMSSSDTLVMSSSESTSPTRSLRSAQGFAGGTGLGAVTAVLGGVYRLTDARHRLRLDRLAAPNVA